MRRGVRLQTYPDTEWGRGMAMAKRLPCTTEQNGGRRPGVPHETDVCYYCKGQGHWKVLNGEQTCPAWLDNHRPECAICFADSHVGNVYSKVDLAASQGLTESLAGGVSEYAHRKM